MSHHFNVDFTVVPPGKEFVSKKLQRNTNISSSAKKKEIRQLEFDNSQMEWRLDQLKKAMTKEKEDRSKQGFIWKSGRNGNLDSYARTILGRSVSATTIGGSVTKKVNISPVRSAPKTKKVRVLKDEPLDLPSRDSQAKELVEKLKTKMPVSPQKEQKPSAEYTSPPNREEWIIVAPDRSSNESMELQSDVNGNILLSNIKAIEPTAVGIYYVKWGRKRLLMAVDGVIRRPKTGWGNETYFPYAGRLYPEMLQKPEPPLHNISNNSSPAPTACPPKKIGGALLKGTFNEDESAASFQKALNNWRQVPVESQKENRTSNHPQMSVHVVQSDQPKYEVEFSQTSTLSYMEKILLNKHRQSEISPMPGSLIDKVNECLEENYDANEEYIFTTEELEERERLRKLFTPEPAAIGTKNSQDKSEVSIYEVIENDCTDETENCIIEESPPASPVLTHRSTNTVVIEEMQFTGTVQNKADQIFSEAVDSSNQPNTGMKSSANWQNSMQINDISPDERSKAPPPRRKTPRSNNSRSTSMKHQSHSQMEMNDTIQFDSAQSHAQDEENHRITHTPSTIVTEIGKLPIDPDALYRRGLDDFFASKSPVEHTETNILPSIHHDQRISTSTVAKVSSSWNPVQSVSSPVMYIKREVHTLINSSKLSSSCETDDEIRDMNDLQDPADELLALDSNNHEFNQQDENTLNELEWELASRTGNITADGRISRIIDEWSDDDDLEIIDDPGLGSGLSSPDIDRKSLSTVNTKHGNEEQMVQDFKNMENIVMGDLEDDYTSSDDEL